MGRRALAAFALISALVTGSSVSAQTNPFQRDFDLVVVKPTPSMNSGIALDGADTLAPKSFHVDFLLDFNFGLLALKLGGQKLGDLVPFRLDGHLAGSYQLLDFLEVGADIPLTLYQSDNLGLLAAQGFPQPGIHAVGLGDIRVLPRLTILRPDRALLGVAFVAETRFPTGDGASFLGDRGLVFAPRIALERAFGPLRVLGNLGVRIRYPSQFLNLYVGNEVYAGVGGIYRLPPLFGLTHNEAMVELHLSTPTAAPFTFAASDSLKTPFEVLVGARTRFTESWGAELDLGRGLTGDSGYGREAFRVLASLRYDFDAAPKGPAKPKVSGDRDHDGIPDDVDKCPDEPEDMDGFEDQDGCPDLDNDKDGIPDTEDVCPNEPGSRELDGCPDRDKDGVPDREDKCPDQPGPAENDGCPMESAPLVVLDASGIRLKGNVLFETGKNVIQKQSYPVLDEVYAVLSKHPEVGAVRVEGHTDNRGAHDYNLDLSNRRSKAVMEYLVTKGLPKERLSAKGFSFDKPVASNESALGRAKNRRVDFTLLKGLPKDTETSRVIAAPPPVRKPAPKKADGGVAP